LQSILISRNPKALSAVTFSAARSELDSMIVGIELTLVSIIQGVALNFLIESARHVISIRQIAFWPYVVSGLLVILIFWSRSILHIITLIRWPLEFGHNFLYIGCALAESLLFTRLGNPAGWFTLGAIFAATGWALFAYDLRLIRARVRDSVSEASNRLTAAVTRDQWLNIAVLLPAVFLCSLTSLICVRSWPDFFLVHCGHVWLSLIQLFGFAGYLFYVVRFYTNLAPLIARAREEWRGQMKTTG
jgi:hypothetical protein